MMEAHKIRIQNIDISPNPVNAKKQIKIEVTVKDVIFSNEIVYLGEKYVGETIGVI